MDLAAVASNGLFSGIILVIQWVKDTLGTNGVIGFFLGLTVMMLFSTIQKNLFKIIFVVLIGVVIVGMSYSASHPNNVVEAADIVKVFFNSSSQNITQIANITK
jgi:hypothetical protein